MGQLKLLLLTNPVQFPNVTKSARSFWYRTNAEWIMPVYREEA